MSEKKKSCGIECGKYAAIDVVPDEVPPIGCGQTCASFCKKFHWWLLACILNSLFSLFVLTFHSVRIYVGPCCLVYLERLCGMGIRFLCACCCESCWRFTDRDFPPNSGSIGQTSANFQPGEKDTSCCCPSVYEKGGDVHWKRPNEIFEDSKGDTAKLFEGKIEPTDIAQGKLGNCWLLAAIATLAEFDGIVPSVFVSRQRSVRGWYAVRLWDTENSRFTRIVVDDHFPCDASGQPLFANPNGRELWVLLLEKAFAKFMGDYAALEGGLPLFAMHLMTGDNCLHWSKDGGQFVCKDLAPIVKPGEDGKLIRSCGFKSTNEKLSSDDMFKLCVSYAKNGCPMGAGTAGKDNTIEEGRGQDSGIVPGHAYSVLDCKEVFDERLIKLRNPWGTFEWGGDWSNKSDKWNQHPNIKSACKFDSDKPEAGAFWMSWDDFMKYFDMIDVCIRSISMKDLKLNTNEDMGWQGPCCGCVQGCAEFWCCCKGPYYAYCGRRSAKVMAMGAVGGGRELAQVQGASGAGSASGAPGEVEQVACHRMIKDVRKWSSKEPSAPSEEAFMCEVREILEKDGRIGVDDWMGLAWQHGCGNSGLQTMLEVFDRLDSAGIASATKQDVEDLWKPVLLTELSVVTVADEADVESNMVSDAEAQPMEAATAGRCLAIHVQQD